MARTNKHDAHKDWILQRLQASPNVSQLVRDLDVERGVKTTNTEVRAWLKTLQRQRARSAAFAALIPDSAGPPGASVQILDSLVHTLRTVADLASVSTQRVDVHVKRKANSEKPSAAPAPKSDASTTIKSQPAPQAPEIKSFPAPSQIPPMPEARIRPADIPPTSSGSSGMSSKISALSDGENDEAIKRLEKARAEIQAKEAASRKPWERK